MWLNFEQFFIRWTGVTWHCSIYGNESLWWTYIMCLLFYCCLASLCLQVSEFLLLFHILEIIQWVLTENKGNSYMIKTLCAMIIVLNLVHQNITVITGVFIYIISNIYRLSLQSLLFKMVKICYWFQSFFSFSFIISSEYHSSHWSELIYMFFLFAKNKTVE